MSSKKKQQCRNPRLPNRFRSLVLISHIISYTRYPPPSLSIRRTRTRAWIAACYTGVAAPEDRLSVKGNIRATGDVLLGDDSVNVLEELQSLRADVNELELGSLSNSEFKSCQDVHDTIKGKTGKAPASGEYAVQGKTQLWK